MDPISGVIRKDHKNHEEHKGFIEDDNDTCKELRERYDNAN